MTFKPLNVAPYCKKLFEQCDVTLIMSATILDFDTFCRNVGLEHSQVKFIEVGSDFPVENRPIYPLNIGYHKEASKDYEHRTPVESRPSEGLSSSGDQNVERSFADGRPRSLIQMARGSGKTFTAVSFIYRLIKFAGAKRVLFLVDRSNLGRQTLKEFQQKRSL